MLDRRKLLAGGAGLAAVASAGLPAQAQTQSEIADGQLDLMLKKQFDATVDASPELATSLGLDTGARAKLKSKLDDRSPAGADKRRELIDSQADQLNAANKTVLSKKGSIVFDVAAFRLITAQDSAKRFRYG